MVNWQGFTLDLVQTVAFLPGHDFNAARAVATILPKYSERFDGDMQVLPLPAEVPPEIPRVALQSKDGRWRLSMGPARIDSVWTNRPATTPADLGEMAQQCAEVLEHYLVEGQLTVARVALVLQRVFPAENPAQMLIQRFCNEASQREPFNRSATFEIHNHKIYSPRQEGAEWRINSWVRCKTARLLADNRPAILVEQDLNTLAEETEPRRYDPAQLRAFFQMAAAEADEIFRKYFPG